jgi:catechol 2,3-dioxygenase-like lactoylglutathione lyase family enzyme
VRVGRCQHAAASGSPFDETSPGLDHLAFGVGTVADLESGAEGLREHGVSHSPIAAANTIAGAKVLVVRDPDNIQLELIATQGDDG